MEGEEGEEGEEEEEGEEWEEGEEMGEKELILLREGEEGEQRDFDIEDDERVDIEDDASCEESSDSFGLLYREDRSRDVHDGAMTIKMETQVVSDLSADPEDYEIQPVTDAIDLQHRCDEVSIAVSPVEPSPLFNIVEVIDGILSDEQVSAERSATIVVDDPRNVTPFVPSAAVFSPPTSLTLATNFASGWEGEVGGRQHVTSPKTSRVDSQALDVLTIPAPTSPTKERRDKLAGAKHDDGVCVDEVVCGLGRGVVDGDKTREGKSGEDRGGRVVRSWVTDNDKTRGNKGGEDGGDEVSGGELDEAEIGGAVVRETRRGDSAGGNASMATDAMEERTETKGGTTAEVVMDAMEEHTETKSDTTTAVATDAMEEHTETKGDTTTAGRVAPTESIVETTKADEEEAANRKGAARVTNDMEGVTKTDEDAGAVDVGNEEEAVRGVTGTDNEEGAMTGLVRGRCVDIRESG
ncbi:hypothetical protein CBR_g23646 [Chara braunii]|uniref:Uncharacterized protein n=1 Tax=Chara braunii TaxID=69332 RepID=A0A388L4U3_CHABU|nr:hypothetical protein CBR_g23646 [Chara braunii]|eukprot:GBG77317.1 hypothetical protein CBR_g23646 [Chara braunii]